jgi:dolichyl-phosphate-mannose-protein mannosyltransferase
MMVKRLRSGKHAMVWLQVALLGILLFLGLLLRLWRLDFGRELPYLAHTDEPTQYNPAIRMIKTGDLNPHFFNYPSLTIYLDAAAMYAGFWIGRLLGVFESIDDLQPIRTVAMAVGVVGTPAMLLLGRAVSAGIGTLTVGLVYVLARRFAKQWWTPLFASLLLAISTAHVRFSHYMTVDVIATFFAVACVAACTVALSRPGDRRLLWLAALCGGLAASSKYNYVVLCVPIGLTCLLDPSAALGRKVVQCAVSALLFGLAFVITSPFVLLDLEHASKGIWREIEHYASGHLGVIGNSFVWYLAYLWQVSPVYLLLGVPGLVVMARQRTRVAVPAIASVAIMYGLIGKQAVHFDRNALPVVVLLIVGVSAAMDAIVAWLSGKANARGMHRAVSSLFAVVLVLVALLPSLWMLPALLQPARPSGKAQAQAWFDRAAETPSAAPHLRKAKIVAEAYTVYMDPQAVDVHYDATITNVEYGLLGLKALDYDVVILGSGMFRRFYDHPEVYASEVRVYDTFWESVPNQLAFESAYDPLEFRDGGGQVYVFFLTERGIAIQRAMKGWP